jgi:chromate transporter
LFWYGVSPFLVILGAAVSGIILSKSVQVNNPGEPRPGNLLFFRQLIIFSIAVMAFLALLFIINRSLFDIALLMMKIDLFAFGGGFASIPLMLQEVVSVHGWVDSKTFMDGIALGQVTPGPIVITATFVGFLTKGLAGAIIATIAIFTPSFLMVVLGAGIFSMLQRSAIFNRAIKGVLASFVGLLLFVTIRFAFAVPWDAIRIVIFLATAAALVRKVDMLYIIPAGAIISVLLL